MVFLSKKRSWEAQVLILYDLQAQIPKMEFPESSNTILGIYPKIKVHYKEKEGNTWIQRIEIKLHELALSRAITEHLSFSLK